MNGERRTVFGVKFMSFNAFNQIYFIQIENTSVLFPLCHEKFKWFLMILSLY